MLAGTNITEDVDDKNEVHRTCYCCKQTSRETKILPCCEVDTRHDGCEKPVCETCFWHHVDLEYPGDWCTDDQICEDLE